VSAAARPQSVAPVLELERLVVRLRGGPPIVDGVSFRIDPGETFALLGESGCGKSMTALALMRLLPDGVEREGGTARMEGLQLFEMSEREMCRVRGGRMAMIFQEPGLSLNPVMTVGQQITEGPTCTNAVSSCWIRLASPMRRGARTNIRSSFPAG